MKIKKNLLKVGLLSAAIIGFFTVTSNANTLNLAIDEFRGIDDNNSYPAYVFESQHIWKLYEINNSVSNYNRAIYCLDVSRGFTNLNAKLTYNNSKDMKNITDTQNILATETNNELKTNYDKVVKILEHIYIKGDTDKTAFLKSMFETSDVDHQYVQGGVDYSKLTDKDIEAVQQLAIWHYTNSTIASSALSTSSFGNLYTSIYTDSSKTQLAPSLAEAVNDSTHILYSNFGNASIKYYLLSEISNHYNTMRTTGSLSSENYYGWNRYNAMVELYKQFINLAESASTTVTTKPIELATSTLSVAKETDRYVVGPYKISKLNSYPYYGFDAKFTDENNNALAYTLLDSSKNATTNTIEGLMGQEFYIALPKTTTVTKVNFNMAAKYDTSKITYWTIAGDNTSQPVAIVDREPENIIGQNSIVMPDKPEFDLALRKFISAVGTVTYNRAPTVDITNLANGTATTAIYNHSKNPVSVKEGDIVTYTIRVYNEGSQDGYVGKVTDYLPQQLEFLNNEFNSTYGWIYESDLRRVSTTKLAYSTNPADTDENNNNLLKAFDGANLKYKDLQIQCKVKSNVSSKEKITNLAQITACTGPIGESVIDRDSTPNGQFILPSDSDLPNYKDDEINTGKPYIPGQEDDDDFEKLIVEQFDLSLRKYISAIGNVNTIGRNPTIDTTNLANGTATTAIYNHSKDPISVKVGDIVTYTITVYNEGDLDGYVDEITDYLPEELEVYSSIVDGIDYKWSIGEDKRTIKTDYLKYNASNTENLLKAYNKTSTLSSKTVKIQCKVKDTAIVGRNITNLAQITKCSNENGETIKDRDSVPNGGFVLPSDENLPEYKDEEIYEEKSYIPGQEDDDDFEKVRIVYFDLALRKFITGVNNNPVTTRIPQVSFADGTGKLKYEHTKEPVEVANNDIVTYTIRVFNEGLISGYASEITDDVPAGLEFLPDNEINKKYRWTLNDEGKITTDYLSKEQETSIGSNLLQAFDLSEISMEEPYNPDYRDVQIAFKVTEPNTSDRILVNTAEISEDKDYNNDDIDDIDSTPDNNNEWNKEDDLDKEFVKVKYFDLALKKWVSKAIVIEDGKENITPTGHTGDENPEPIVKVDLYRKNLKKVTVKFEYQIKVTNEGEIAGYVKELTDYIPEGLKFVQDDNKNWTEKSSGIVVTKELENKLLQPGESATVTILLTWINGENNMGLKTNVAEISKDYNESDSPDIDSTPNNKKEGEDDIDDAPVMLSIMTGKEEIYLGLAFTVLATIGAGVVLIKKYVL